LPVDQQFALALLPDRPMVVLLDEPAGHLDTAAADAVLAIALYRARHPNLLWVTHRRSDLAMFLAAVDLELT
jgi:ABC-type transport system involved in cytochrome bd biosynthesis fused ATPase/permease subunit